MSQNVRQVVLHPANPGYWISERGVEKHINSVFSKLSLSEDDGSHKRVPAALLYLAQGSPDV